MKTCTFFGHRDCPDSVKDTLSKTIYELIHTQDVVVFYVGNRGNFDALATAVLLEYKLEYPWIQCYTVLDKLPSSTDHYFKLDTIYPDTLENIPKKYTIDHRNRWMLNRSDIVVAYVRFPFGGAAKFVDLANKQNKIVINLHTNE